MDDQFRNINEGDFNSKIPRKFIEKFWIVLGIIITIVFLGHYFYQEKKEDNKISYKGEVAEEEKVDVIDGFKKSNYRVLKVINNPFDKYQLHIVSERAKTRCYPDDDYCERNGNDVGCGSIYNFSQCYFFTEPLYIHGVNPETRFIASWKGGLDGINLDSIEFKDANTFEFESSGGDAGLGVYATWSVDLINGSVTKLSEKYTEVPPF